MKILVTKSGANDFSAQLKGRPSFVGIGRSVDEAIGHFVRCNRDVFNIIIEDKSQSKKDDMDDDEDDDLGDRDDAGDGCEDDVATDFHEPQGFRPGAPVDWYKQSIQE